MPPPLLSRTYQVLSDGNAGMMQARKAPKLSDFNEPGVSFEEKKRRHAEAMHVWMVKNVSKTGIQKGTQARKHRILNAERERGIHFDQHAEPPTPDHAYRRLGGD